MESQKSRGAHVKASPPGGSPPCVRTSKLFGQYHLNSLFGDCHSYVHEGLPSDTIESVIIPPGLDISADLTELGRTPIAVVSAGVKSILDIGRTLEFLVRILRSFFMSHVV